MPLPCVDTDEGCQTAVVSRGGSLRLFMLALSVAVAWSLVLSGTAAASDEPRTVYWIFAHPDDETLAAGAAIGRSVEAGNENVVILVSSGENTRVRELLSLTRAQVVTSRLLEALDALGSIGVQDVRFVSIADGEVKASDIETMIDQIVVRHAGEDIAFRGHSPLDTYEGLPCGHPDHCEVGKALVSKWRAGAIEDLELYRIGHLFGEPLEGECRDLTAQEQQMKIQMLNAYAFEDPSQSRFGIGMHSVGRVMERAPFMPECVDTPASLNAEGAEDSPALAEECGAGWSSWRSEMQLRPTCGDARSLRQTQDR